MRLVFSSQLINRVVSRNYEVEGRCSLIISLKVGCSPFASLIFNLFYTTRQHV